ncbi:MAG: DUF2914 domain-containing protein [Gammaproteobacteria bacterium]|nr:DUF2914 domain-containing protein [Gammaproteobacteria bacterium]
MKKLITLISVCFLFITFSVYSAGIDRSIFTTAIIDKEPVSNLKDITSDITRVYYFTEITGLNGHTISHRWEYDGQVVAEINFKVSGDRWRTWSSKNMLSSWLGKWRVSVLDEGGNIIEQSEFDYLKAQQVLAAPVAIESAIIDAP